MGQGLRYRRTLMAALAVCVASIGAAQTRQTETPQAQPVRLKSTDELVTRTGEAIDLKTHPGKALFTENCAGCHMGGVPKAPAVIWLEMMAPDAILGAMRGGLMNQQAAHLKPQQQVEIAEYLTRTKLADYKPPAPPARCTGAALQFVGPPPAEIGWGHDNRRFVPAPVAAMTAADAPKLTLKWAFAYPAAVRARSQPVIGWNTIFVGSQNGTVYAFDLASGCAKWTFRASAEIRTAIVADADSKRLYFGDVLGRAYAVDAMTGASLWQAKPDSHPNATITGSPTLGGGMLFVPVSSLEVTSAADAAYPCCSFRGAVVALDPATGAVKWKTYTIPDAPTPQGKTDGGVEKLGPSGAPVWGSPTYDAKRNRLYFGSGENYSSPADGNSDAVFAVDATTGRKLWQVQFTAQDAWNVGCMVGNDACPKENGPDLDLAASSLLVDIAGGRQMLVLGQKSGVVHGVDPDSGKIIWHQRLGHGGTQGGVHFGMAADGSKIYVPITDLADTHDGRQYDKSINGSGIHAIDAATGTILWRHKAQNICGDVTYCDPGISSAATALPGGVMVGGLDGQFHVYDGTDGKVLWSYDTRKPVRTITGVMATGGGMSGPGAAIYDRHVVFNSGYGLYYHMPGNLLLVFQAPR